MPRQFTLEYIQYSCGKLSCPAKKPSAHRHTSLKVAVFSDEQNTVFRDRKEFTGSIFKQLEGTYAYLQLCNQNRSVIQGLARADFWDYPEFVIREALLNALIHRDYSFSGSIIINVNDKSMEFTSIGGLLPGLLPDDIRNGISQLRNRKLADIFLRLNYIESYGSGIRRIFAHYDKCSEKPHIVTTLNSFKITLPNMNEPPKHDIPKAAINPQMQQMLEFISEKHDITEEELQEKLGIKRTRLYSLSTQMANMGLIKISGRGKRKKFIII